MIIGANGASGGLGALIGGAQPTGSASGGGLGSTISQLTGALSQGAPKGVGSVLGSVGSMALAGSALGPIGAAGGALLGLVSNIGSLFGGPGVPDHERPDLNRIAAANDITGDQASWVCGLEESKSPRNYDDIVAQAANDNGYFLQLLSKYNAAKPNEQIKTRTAIATEQAAPQYLQLQTQMANTFAGTGQASPLANLSFPAAQAAAKQQNMTLSDYLTAIVNGALAGLQKGVSDAVAETPAAQDLKKSVIKDWVKENQLVVAGAGIGLVWLISQAVQNNRK